MCASWVATRQASRVSRCWTATRSSAPASQSRASSFSTVTELGYGKRTEMNEYLRLDETGERRPQQRGGKGLKNYNITAKTGRMAGVAIVSGEDDVMLIENGGVLDSHGCVRYQRL